jgi:hypothetical protein
VASALRTVHVRQFEYGAIPLGLVHSRKGKYVSDETLRRRQKQSRRKRAILEHCVIQDYAMREDGDKPGAAKHRDPEKRIDRSKDTAASYIAKYISKNIDGFAWIAISTAGSQRGQQNG